ncbi:hypothetical protein UlMin_001787 [Ulmus minor]
MSSPLNSFRYKETESTILPDPSLFFSSKLLSNPLPTNSFFQNFALKNGDQPEYIHPYLVKSSSSSLSISYPVRESYSSFFRQNFSPDITISASENADCPKGHQILSFSDLSVTLEIPSCNLQFFLVRGSPFVTCFVCGGSVLSISSAHKIVFFSLNKSQTKCRLKLDNKQTWIVYSSAQLKMSFGNFSITSTGSGFVRIAILPESNPQNEDVLDNFRHCCPFSGNAEYKKPFCLEYKWEKKGFGKLLMLAHPLHIRLLDHPESGVTILKEFKLESIDGELVGVIGSSWLLKVDPLLLSWYSLKGIREESHQEIGAALAKDVKDLSSIEIKNKSLYAYGKLITKAARLALIAEELSRDEFVQDIKKFLKEKIEPWLEGTWKGNGFCYERKWGGILTEDGAKNDKVDFGFGMYNNHHFHLGYFVYALAVLVKFDPEWGRKYKPQAYALIGDYMNWEKGSSSLYPRLRGFDLYMLHSWGSGLSESEDGRHQQSVSEAVNAYYAAALMGLAYGDIRLSAIGSTLAAMEIKAAQMWWHIREGNTLYGEAFTEKNRIMGVLRANKRDSNLLSFRAESREARLAFQVQPLSPITEILFSDVDFVKELVEWALPSLERGVGVVKSLVPFVYAMQGMIDNEGALEKIRLLENFGDNSLANLLWWVHRKKLSPFRFSSSSYDFTLSLNY